MNLLTICISSRSKSVSYWYNLDACNILRMLQCLETLWQVLIIIFFFKKFEHYRRLFKHNVSMSVPKSSWHFLFSFAANFYTTCLIPNIEYIHQCRCCSFYIFFNVAFFVLFSLSNQSCTANINIHSYAGKISSCIQYTHLKVVNDIVWIAVTTQRLL